METNQIERSRSSVLPTRIYYTYAGRLFFLFFHFFKCNATASRMGAHFENIFINKLESTNSNKLNFLKGVVPVLGIVNRHVLVMWTTYIRRTKHMCHVRGQTSGHATRPDNQTFTHTNDAVYWNFICPDIWLFIDSILTKKIMYKKKNTTSSNLAVTVTFALNTFV